MRNGKGLYWIAQFAGWSAYGALILLAAYADESSKVDLELIVNVVSLVFFSILSTHLMRDLFVRLQWLDLKPGPLIPRVAIASVACALIISFLTTAVSLLIDWEEVSVLTILGIVIKILAILVLILFWNAIYFTFHFFQKSKKQELNNLTLEASKNEIELKNLRSQLNPHFLFNSLNSIRALIELDPPKAKEAVTKLSGLLRRSLIMGKENLVSLDEELEMVSNYLELEKIRFEERLAVKWEIDRSLSAFMVPPFILQMLVENAIKHGISNLIEGGEIMIRTERVDEDVIITVINSGSLGNDADTGIGIQNTRRRLDIQFKGTVDLELKQEGDQVVARLIFKSNK
jgi:two-component system, LytTR family, sensor kinase